MLAHPVSLRNESLLALWQPPFQRFGEARKPGPSAWHLRGVDVSSCLQIGTLNAGALLRKEDVLASLGSGIWTASETHHTASAVPVIRGRMHKRGVSNAFFPASDPLRNRSCANERLGVRHGLLH